MAWFKFQSTRPSRGETCLSSLCWANEKNSIHSPLAGRDRMRNAGKHAIGISIHSPLAGRDVREPARRYHHGYFNPLAPRGARHTLPSSISRDKIYFNPLAPRGARPEAQAKHLTVCGFQSTRPSRGETIADQQWEREFEISIHSPLAGRDSSNQSGNTQTSNFNPLAPRGARLFGTGRFI